MGLHILVFWRSFIVSDIGILFELGLGFAYFSILEVGLDHLIFWNCLASNAHLFLPGEFFGLTATSVGRGRCCGDYEMYSATLGQFYFWKRDGDPI